MNDLISRQAAIDALEEPCKVPDTWTDEYAVGERMQWEKDVKALNGLPSAQSEIIRCKDCRHFEYDHPYIIQGIPVLGHEVCNAWGNGCKTDENGWCFLGERRVEDETD